MVWHNCTEMRFCFWLEEMDTGPKTVVSIPLDAVTGGTWRRDEVPHMCGSGKQICKGHSCTLTPLMRCIAHMELVAIGCVKVQWVCNRCVDLRVVPDVRIETGPTVTWKLVRILPTVELVRRDCPQCVGSVLPSDSRLGSACTMEASKIPLPLQGRRNSNALHSSSHLAVLPTL